jgi:tetratricopeptide (TPR) repeat protein
MTKSQIGVIAGAVILFCILYFGFDTIPPKQKDLEKSRALNFETTSVDNLILEARTKLTKEQQSIVHAYDLDLQKNEKDTTKRLVILQSLSKTWYDMGFLAIAGYYAEEIAKIQKTEEAWSIAGTTFALGVKNAEEKKMKDFCSKHAIKAFEKAISINPEKVESRINLAICYIDNPSENDPMQGIMMLRDLNSKYPQNVAVLNQLGGLALQTNQVDKALERLEMAIQLEPENMNTICLLAAAYQLVGKEEKSKEYKKKCIN